MTLNYKVIFCFSLLFLINTYSLKSQYKGTASVTQGKATLIDSNLYSCMNGRICNKGIIQSTDGNNWIVPSATHFKDNNFPFASDLYNSCIGKNYSNYQQALSALIGSDIITIDNDGELITAFIFADNYFEMYINGIPVGKDNVPYTQFNSNIIRFKVKRPFTIAMLLVDWEENLGLGSENNTGLKYYNGDGGMVAVFKDEKMNTIATTHKGWKAQCYYTAPIKDLNCPKEIGSLRLSDQCSTQGSNDGSQDYALHWNRPSDWMMPNYNDKDWPSAYEFTNTVVGVNNKASYTNFTDIFDDSQNDAQFIWSSNLILDNEILVRYKVGISTQVNDKSLQIKNEIHFINDGQNLFIHYNDEVEYNNLKQLIIYNLSGQKVYSNNNHVNHIQLSDFKPGMYFMNIKFSDHQIIQKFIVEQ